MLAGIRSRFRNDPLVGNVIALIALGIAVGLGTAYAAGLAPDSVKSKHIVDRQVKAQDLADEYVKSGGATFTSFGFEAYTEDNCGPGTLPPPWMNIHPAAPAGYWRDEQGIVHLQGTIIKCANGVIATLPPGMRPILLTLEPVGSTLGPNPGDPGPLEIEPDGDLFPHANNPSLLTVWGLDGVSFRCGPPGQNGCP